MIGCLIANLIAGCAVYDVIFGSIVTLIAAMFTFLTGRFIKKTWLKILIGGLFPVVLNALLLPVIWYFCYGELEFLYIVQVGFLLISQSVAIYGLGTPLYIAIDKLGKKYPRIFGYPNKSDAN